MSAPTTATVEELVPAAIELAERTGSVPSINRLTKTFRIGQPKAKEIYKRLQMESAKRRSRRARKQADASRKAPARRIETRVFDPAVVPVSPGVGPADPWSHAFPVRVPEEVPPLMDEVRPVAPVEPLPKPVRPLVTWPVLLVAGGAFVAIWAGWVSLGKLTGFGKVNLLPGFWSGWTVDTAITLPLGMEAYSAYAFYVWLHHSAPRRARRFAAWSSLGAVVLGMGGQTAYHLMEAAGKTAAPWWITTVVSCLPVAVFGLAAALVHMVRAGDDEKES